MKNSDVIVSRTTDIVREVDILYLGEDLIIFRIMSGPQRPSVVSTGSSKITLAPTKVSNDQDQVDFQDLPLKEPFLYGWIPGRYYIDVIFMSYDVEKEFSRREKKS